MRVSLEEVTVKKAQEWLKKNLTNRPVRQSVVLRYAGAITRGEWLPNGETIKFDVKGNLVDGQHRLYAIIAAGISVKSMVARDVPENAFGTIDIGAPRGLADYFGIHGETNSVRLAGALKIVKFLTQEPEIVRKKWNDPISPKQGFEELSKHSGLPESVKYACSAVKGVMAPSPASALHYLFKQRDAVLADLFFDSLGSGVGLKKSDPVYRLRELLLTSKKGRTSVKGQALLVMSIKAWNLTREGRPCTALRWLPTEDFPKIK